MSILDKIINVKRKEVKELKEIKTVKALEKSLFFNSDTVSMCNYLKRKDSVGIIAEIKRSSPSTGLMNEDVNVEEVSVGYMQGGASALSVLTDNTFFSGSNEDLKLARKYNYCPILRKDFIIDPYQVIEAKSIGADCVLLIAACLTKKECEELALLAKKLELEVLLEVHNEEEVSYVNDYVDIVGVNNRDLKTFKTNISKSIELSSLLPKDRVWISESGIESAMQIRQLKEHGFQGFLIGGHFMKQSKPTLACQQLVKDFNTQS